MKRQTICVLIAAAALTACAGPLGEFRPLYATAAGPGLSRVETRAPDGRAAYLLREEVDDAFAFDRTQPPLYRLMLRIEESRIPRGLRIDNVANRYELTLEIDYVLIDLSTNLALDRGVVVSNVTYDSADQPYASIAAQQDGQKRASADAAQRLRIVLATYFANRKPQTPLQIQAATLRAQQGDSLTDRLAPQPVGPAAQEAEAEAEATDSPWGEQPLTAPDPN